MPEFRIKGLDKDYHGALVESFTKEFASIEEARAWCVKEAPLGVTYMVSEVPPHVPAPYQHTITDHYMKRGMI